MKAAIKTTTTTIIIIIIVISKTRIIVKIIYLFKIQKVMIMNMKMIIMKMKIIMMIVMNFFKKSKKLRISNILKKIRLFFKWER